MNTVNNIATEQRFVTCWCEPTASVLRGYKAMSKAGKDGRAARSRKTSGPSSGPAISAAPASGPKQPTKIQLRHRQEHQRLKAQAMTSIPLVDLFGYFWWGTDEW